MCVVATAWLTVTLHDVPEPQIASRVPVVSS